MGINNKGQTMFYSFMLALTIIVLALALSPIGKEFVVSAMSAPASDTLGLDCQNSSISNFDRAACVVTDFSQFYFFGSLILIAGGVIVAKIVF